MARVGGSASCRVPVVWIAVVVGIGGNCGGRDGGGGFAIVAGAGAADGGGFAIVVGGDGGGFGCLCWFCYYW